MRRLTSHGNDELLLASRDIGGGLRQTDLSVPTIHCGGCIQTIEQTLGALPGVEQARVNLSARRVDDPLARRWHAAPFIETLRRIGYEAHLYDSATDPKDGVAELVRALAVAGFAASNIMLLSVSVWSGADPDNPRPFSLDFGADRDSSCCLFRPHLLPLGLAEPSSRPYEYGRSDLRWRLACRRPEPLRDGPPRTARLFRRLDHAAVLPADRTHARSHDAGEGPHPPCKGLARLGSARRTRPGARRRADLSPAERDRPGHDDPAGCRRARPGRWPGR